MESQEPNYDTGRFPTTAEADFHMLHPALAPEAQVPDAATLCGLETEEIARAF